MTKKHVNKEGKESLYNYSEIRINGVSPDLHIQLINIAKHLGIPFSSWIKPKLREIADSYPDDMKKPIKKEE